MTVSRPKIVRRPSTGTIKSFDHQKGVGKILSEQHLHPLLFRMDQGRNLRGTKIAPGLEVSLVTTVTGGRVSLDHWMPRPGSAHTKSRRRFSAGNGRDGDHKNLSHRLARARQQPRV